MTDSIIDRRGLDGKKKSVGNRERFLRRHKDVLREAVQRSVDGRGIRDVAQGEDIKIPKKDIKEPVFSHSQQGGDREVVHPGNKEYVRGDKIDRPKGGGGKGGGGQASDTGEGDDDFTFHLTKEEFMDIFFGDLALPNLMRTTITDTPEWKSHRAGFTTDGTPTNLALVRSMKNKIGRRIGTGIPGQLDELVEQFALLRVLYHSEDAEPVSVVSGPEPTYHEVFTAIGSEIATVFEKCSRRDPLDMLYRRDNEYIDALKELEAEFSALLERLRRIPGLDPLDLRYRARVKLPVPIAKAVMFCLMDVSGSMDEARKNLAKRFFILLYLFLTRHYERIDIVFIRHHTQATEVDEEGFFHSTETGGTVVSSALVLMEQIIRDRYPTSEWNIYGAQASDGDNWHHDSGRCRELLVGSLLPLCRYFAYIQVAEDKQNLWEEYATVEASEANRQNKNFAMKRVSDQSEIYPVFRELFKKGVT